MRIDRFLFFIRLVKSRTLAQGLVEEGRIRIDDSIWRVAGPDSPAGTRIRVEAADGTLLRVAPLG